VDDCLLWINIVEKVTKVDYVEKMDLINKMCNDAVKVYEEKNEPIFEENFIQKNIKTKRDELEQLCFTISCGIENNMFSFDDDHVANTLKKIVEESMNWLLEHDIKVQKSVIENGLLIELAEDEIQKCIDKINDECNRMYSKMTGIHLDMMKIVPVEEEATGSILYNESFDSCTSVRIKMISVVLRFILISIVLSTLATAELTFRKLDMASVFILYDHILYIAENCEPTSVELFDNDSGLLPISIEDDEELVCLVRCSNLSNFWSISLLANDDDAIKLLN
jgi:hypothetical protein